MTTLLSKNQEKSINLKMKGYTLKDGDRLLCGIETEIKKAEKFLDKNGLGGLYFNPDGDVEIYSDYSIESALYSEAYGIMFLK